MQKFDRKNIILIVLSTFVGLVLSEIGLRLFVPELDILLPDKNLLFASWPAGMRVTVDPDQRFIKGITGPSYFRTNSWGIRGDELSSTDEYRILIIGGSAVECHYIDQEKTFSALLQKHLSKQRPTWVGNLGKSGFAMRDHFFQVKFALDNIPDLDLILVMAGVNDLQYFLGSTKTVNQRTIETAHPNLMIEQKRGLADFFYLGRLLKDLFSRSDYGQLRVDLDGRQLEGLRAKRFNAPKIEQMPDLQTGLESFSNGTLMIQELVNTSAKTKVIFLTQPFLWRERMPQELEQLLWYGGKGFFFSDPNPEFYSTSVLHRSASAYNAATLTLRKAGKIAAIDLSAEISENEENFFDDVHLTEKGSERIAEILARELRPHPP